MATAEFSKFAGILSAPTLSVGATKPEGQIGDWPRAMLRGKESSQLELQEGV